MSPAHIRTWALRTRPVHIRSRTLAQRMRSVRIRPDTRLLRMALVHMRRHSRLLRTRRFRIPGRRALRTPLLHWLGPPASRKPVRLQRQCRRLQAPHRLTVLQRSQRASMTTLLLLQQEQVVGSSS
jgi:hypothetical protein